VIGKAQGALPRAAKVVLIGAGAQAKYALETFRHLGVEVVGVMSSEEAAGPDWIAAYGSVAFAADPTLRHASRHGATHALVCFADPDRKAEWWSRMEAARLSPVSAIHPAATIASTARVGTGCIVNAGAVIQPFAVVGRGVMIHANAIVEHDAIVEDFANLAPGVRLAGWTHIEQRATIFTGASVIPRVRIGRGATVGAGAAVISDIPPGSLAVGVPARLVQRRKDQSGGRVRRADFDSSRRW
jgi:sugar O-acyltransferase (sialic acid O-acetyltransferase NeuD family)